MPVSHWTTDCQDDDLYWKSTSVKLVQPYFIYCIIKVHEMFIMKVQNKWNKAGSGSISYPLASRKGKQKKIKKICILNHSFSTIIHVNIIQACLTLMSETRSIYSAASAVSSPPLDGHGQDSVYFWVRNTHAKCLTNKWLRLPARGIEYFDWQTNKKQRAALVSVIIWSCDHDDESVK